jgi:zinc and cadmium transporter
MTLFWIILATTVAGILSIAAAASLSLTVLSRMVDKMVSLSVGVLLATALLHSLPEAFTTPAVDIPSLFITLLIGLLGFFVLEKAALLRHSHHHEHDGHGHHHGHDAESAGKSGWVILLGDGLHNFADGILIAAAFLVDPHIGVLTAVAIALHEIPQEVGDFIVLLNAGFTKTRALVYNFLSSMMAVLGGVIGYFFLDRAEGLIPYVIVLASSSFIYIAVSDLMPQMHRRPKLKESLEQVLLIALGVILVLFISELGHWGHDH